MKKMILSAMMALVPGTALATSLHPDTFQYAEFTGRVKVETIFCVTYPCPPRVYLEGKDGSQVTIKGELLRDVEAFAGKVVTVKGTKYDASIDFTSGIVATDFAPGPWTNFVTGRVVDLADCPPNAMCAPQLGLEALDGTVTPIAGSMEYETKLSALIGATVTLRGRQEIEPACDLCMGGQLVFRPNEEANVYLKGRLSPAYHIMVVPEPGQEFAEHFLELPNGRAVPLFGEGHHDKNDRTVWVAARFEHDYRGANILRIRGVSEGVIPDPAIEPLPWDVASAQGSNVDRNADTDGAVSGSASSGTASTGGGATR